ncbi:DUF4221 domain-containing protein [Algoriphagus sp. AGSA1]|uniref:DUF4221 family protein n=1 Tax=Algoriphagus sp. AGSA1 TaxID=2907213 RepID=UPI001F28BFD6|nr:DUF4221 family protein [Algoriphagus sp. AGSA1]MCE7055782.1 DUF4221 domain-containing protein [Algoriphagus sp. AGSA1]
MKKYLFILLIVAFSCNSEQENFEVQIELEEYYIFELDSLTRRDSKHVGFVPSLNSIYLFNDNTYTLYFYNLATKENWKRIPFAKEGPEGLGRVDLFKVYSLDSIFSVNEILGQITRISDEGKKIEKIRILDMDNGDPAIQSGISFFEFHKSKLFTLARQTPNVLPLRNKILLEYDFDTKKKSYEIEWPIEYIEDWMMATKPSSAVMKDDKVYLSLPYNEHILIYDLINGNLEKKYAGSSKIKKYVPYSGGGDMQSRIRHVLEGARYGKLVYEPTARVYLREASVGLSIPIDANPLLATSESGSFLSNNNDNIYVLTIVLDESLNKIGEVPHQKLYQDAFCADSALFRRVVIYEKENEDILVFGKYKVKY